MSSWAEWWHGDATKEEYESSCQLDAIGRSSLIERILGGEDEESDEVDEV